MATYDIAHIREQGQNIIILPLDRQFGFLTESEKLEFIAYIQAAARAARLAGTVVPIWDAGNGRSAFIAPQPWHPYFSSLPLQAVLRMRNKRLRVA